MDPHDNFEEALDLLQLLGFNEYEARCYIGLTRMDEATSKRLSEATDVPRARVYDAIRVLEAQGLVEIQHSSPKRFRAVPIEEALDRIRNRYQARFAELHEALNTIEPLDPIEEAPTQQVWSVTGREAIEAWVVQLLEVASVEVVLALGDESVLTEPFAETLRGVGGHVDLVIYAPTEAMCDRVRGIVPFAKTGFAGPPWFRGSIDHGGAPLGRILVCDQSASLISSLDETEGERAVIAQGQKNPLVSLVRQLMVDDGFIAAPESSA